MLPLGWAFDIAFELPFESPTSYVRVLSSSPGSSASDSAFFLCAYQEAISNISNTWVPVIHVGGLD